jgi:putative ABC transport system ATP-binding protein
VPTDSHPSEPSDLPVDAAGRPVVFIAKGLTKTYQMGEVKVHALQEVDLSVYWGEFIVLLGASGSGKSSLLNILGDWTAPAAARPG